MLESFWRESATSARVQLRSGRDQKGAGGALGGLGRSTAGLAGRAVHHEPSVLSASLACMLAYLQSAFAVHGEGKEALPAQIGEFAAGSRSLGHIEAGRLHRQELCFDFSIGHSRQCLHILN